MRNGAPKLVLVAGFVLAAGCGGSVATDGGNGAGPSAADFPALLEQLACDTIDACCAAAPLPFDRAACLKGFGVDPVRSGAGIAYDSAAAQRCLDEFRSATRGCSAFDKAQLPNCNLTTYGTLPIGAPCTSDRACALVSGQFVSCHFEVNGSSGTCTLEPSASRGALGDGCQATCAARGCEVVVAGQNDPPTPLSDCFVADGLYCTWGAPRCAHIGNSGDACYAPNGCAAGLVCVAFADLLSSGTGAIRPGTCGPPRADGFPCVSSEECASYACDRNTGGCVHVPLASPNLCLGILPGAD